ncbi:hypothetical protein [Mycobacteroides franklinii]|uniref:DUF7374 family protein n=1 Tax=Mycobacteroides franklinii TaxID=948102 RepID=UPI00099470F7|nr:hypothetical protein [Mycobacteroides franklinii]
MNGPSFDPADVSDYDDELVANIEDVIWTALEHQAESGMVLYANREMGLLDATGAGVDMTAVAAAVSAIFVDKQGDCSWCHNPCAVDGWKLPPEPADSAETRD